MAPVVRSNAAEERSKLIWVNGGGNHEDVARGAVSGSVIGSTPALRDLSRNGETTGAGLMGEVDLLALVESAMKMSNAAVELRKEP